MWMWDGVGRGGAMVCITTEARDCGGPNVIFGRLVEDWDWTSFAG